MKNFHGTEWVDIVLKTKSSLLPTPVSQWEGKRLEYSVRSEERNSIGLPALGWSTEREESGHMCFQTKISQVSMIWCLAFLSLTLE